MSTKKNFKSISADEALLLRAKDYVIEEKLDGTAMTWNGKTLISDRGIVRNARFPHIVAALKEYNKVNTVMGFGACKIRGEVCIPGGNVHTVNKRENWPKAKFYITGIPSFNGYINSGAYQEICIADDVFAGDAIVKVPRRFKSVQAGLNFVKRTDGEGLVFKRIDAEQFLKYKALKEAKVEIIRHVSGADKGAFVINMNGVEGKVSGTSVEFVRTVKAMMKSGKKAYAEIEYPMLTENGIPFQPRLRRVGSKQSLRYS